MRRLYDAFTRGPEEGAVDQGLTGRIRAMRLADARRYRDLQHPGYALAAAVGVPPANGVIHRAPCDNAEVFQAMGSAGCNILLCITRTCDIAPFAAADVAAHRVTVRGLRVASILSGIRVRNNALRVQQVIAECLAPEWPEDRSMPRDQSREEIARLLANTSELRDLAWFADRTQEMARSAPPPANVGDDIILQQAWNFTQRTWVVNIDLNQKMAFLDSLANLTDERQASRALYPVLLILFAYAS